MRWRRLNADDCDWEVRVFAAGVENGPKRSEKEEILEFRPVDAIRPPRRTLIAAGVLEGMSDADLLVVYRRARPIGADFYGRPGKHMPDTHT